MNEHAQMSRCRARVVTAVVLLVVGGLIALANLPCESLTLGFMTEVSQGGKPERASGWPFRWYWRSPKRVPREKRWLGSAVAGSSGVVTLEWPVARCSMRRFAANLGLWLLILAASWAGFYRALRRNPPRLRWQPRFTTLLVLTLQSALTLLANLSSESDPKSLHGFGWPFIWYWHAVLVSPFSFYEESDFSAAVLLGNMAIWLAMLAVTAVAWERLLSRYRPGFRWSLKTMLGAVAIIAVSLAWAAAVRSRAREQDAVISRIGNDHYLYLERVGPNWLDLIGADRFRRRIIGASVHEIDGDLFEKLSRIQSLRFLDIAPYLYNRPFAFTPRIGALLASMQQLRLLNVECQGDDVDDRGAPPRAATDECLAAVGKISRLERVRLELWSECTDGLAYLSDLKHLKSLSLHIRPFTDGQGRRLASVDGHPRTLMSLPALQCLESLELDDWEFDDAQIGWLAGCKHLRSLDLSQTAVTDAGLPSLASLESLEELAINEYTATRLGFDAIVGLRHLKAVHIAVSEANRTDAIKSAMAMRRARFVMAGRRDADGAVATTLALDDGKELVVLAFELDGLRREIQSLRRSHPGVVIDAAYAEFEKRADLKPPWDEIIGDRLPLDAFVNRWLK